MLAALQILRGFMAICLLVASVGPVVLWFWSQTSDAAALFGLSIVTFMVSETVSQMESQ